MEKQLVIYYMSKEEKEAGNGKKGYMINDQWLFDIETKESVYGEYHIEYIGEPYLSGVVI